MESRNFRIQSSGYFSLDQGCTACSGYSSLNEGCTTFQKTQDAPQSSGRQVDVKASYVSWTPECSAPCYKIQSPGRPIIRSLCTFNLDLNLQVAIFNTVVVPSVLRSSGFTYLIQPLLRLMVVQIIENYHPFPAIQRNISVDSSVAIEITNWTTTFLVVQPVAQSLY